MAETSSTPVAHQRFRPDLPAIVVCRHCPDLYPPGPNPQPLPINRVPLENRTGRLSIILVLGWLEISGTGHDGIYPKGAALQYGRACELLVRVFPRNLPDRQYASWQRDLLVPTVRLPGSRTPLFVSTEAAPLMSSVRRIPSALEEVRLLPRSTLAFYLESALPLLGTDPADIVPTIRHIRRVLSRGKKQIQALTTE